MGSEHTEHFGDLGDEECTGGYELPAVTNKNGDKDIQMDGEVVVVERERMVGDLVKEDSELWCFFQTSLGSGGLWKISCPLSMWSFV